MKTGGIRRIEVPGDVPALGYPRDRGERYTSDMGAFKYRFGPQPSELGGKRALDFVLDNETLPAFNRELYVLREGWGESLRRGGSGTAF